MYLVLLSRKVHLTDLLHLTRYRITRNLVSFFWMCFLLPNQSNYVVFETSHTFDTMDQPAAPRPDWRPPPQHQYPGPQESSGYSQPPHHREYADKHPPPPSALFAAGARDDRAPPQHQFHDQPPSHHQRYHHPRRPPTTLPVSSAIPEHVMPAFRESQSSLVAPPHQVHCSMRSAAGINNTASMPSQVFPRVARSNFPGWDPSHAGKSQSPGLTNS